MVCWHTTTSLYILYSANPSLLLFVRGKFDVIVSLRERLGERERVIKHLPPWTTLVLLCRVYYSGSLPDLTLLLIRFYRYLQPVKKWTDQKKSTGVLVLPNLVSIIRNR